MPIKTQKTNKKPQIRFWRGLIHDGKINLDAYDEDLKRFLGGERNGFNLERLHIAGDYPIYSIRTNDSTRVIFTTVNGYFLLLDVVTAHDYQKCAFLKSKALKHFLRMNGAVIADVITQLNNEAVVDDIGIAPQDLGDQPIEKVAIEFIGGRQICLSDEQGHILTSEIPAQIIGPAGSGKTCLALFMLRDYILSNPDAHPIYVTRSPELARKMHSIWQGMEGSPNVYFWDYKTFLIKRGFLKPGTNIKTKRDFFTWYLEDTAKYPGLDKCDKSDELHLNLVWEEVRNAAERGNLQSYRALGKKQSQLAGNQLRKDHIYALYERYQKSLAPNEINLDLLKPELCDPLDEAVLRDPIDFLAIDEEQDLKSLALECLCSEAEGRIVSFYGEHQVLGGNARDTSILGSVFHQAGWRQPNVHRLPGITYRNPKAVMALCQKLLELKRLVTGGATLKGEETELKVCEDASYGSVLWYEATDEKVQQCLALHKDTASFVILTTEEFLDEVHQRFGSNVLILTIEQAKGLEFDHVVMYKTLSGSAYYQISTVLKSKAPTQVASKNRPTDLSHMCFRLPFDQALTGFTRSMKTLTMFEQNSPDNSALLHPLMASSTAFSKEATAAMPQPPKTSTKLEWRSHVAKLVIEGGEASQQARALWGTHGLGTDEDFENFKAQLVCNVSRTPIKSMKIQAHVETQIAAETATENTPTVDQTPKGKFANTIMIACGKHDEGMLLKALKEMSELRVSDVFKQPVGDKGIKLEDWLENERDFFVGTILSAPDPFSLKHLFTNVLDKLFIYGHKALLDRWNDIRKKVSSSKKPFGPLLPFLIETSTEMSETLIILGANIHRHSPLLCAVKKGDVLITKLLLKLGARPQDTYDEARLYIFAILYKNAEILNALASHGVNVTSSIHIDQKVLETLPNINRKNCRQWIQDRPGENRYKITPLIMTEIMGSDYDEIRKLLLIAISAQEIGMGFLRDQNTDFIGNFQKTIKSLINLASKTPFLLSQLLFLVHPNPENPKENLSEFILADDTRLKTFIGYMLDRRAAPNLVRDFLEPLSDKSHPLISALLQFIDKFTFHLEHFPNHYPVEFAAFFKPKISLAEFVGLGGNIDQPIITTACGEPISILMRHALFPLETSLNDIRILLGAGANPNQIDFAFRNPVQIAIEKGNEPLLLLLLEKGGEINTPCSTDNITPLFLACIMNNERILKLLINRFADLSPSIKWMKEQYFAYCASSDEDKKHPPLLENHINKRLALGDPPSAIQTTVDEFVEIFELHNIKRILQEARLERAKKSSVISLTLFSPPKFERTGSNKREEDTFLRIPI